MLCYCFAIPCNKVNNLIKLLKSAYCIIYSNSKYLIEFDYNFRHTIKKTYGDDAVSFNDNKGKLTIKLKNENIELKYPSLNSVIDIHSSPAFAAVRPAAVLPQSCGKNFFAAGLPPAPLLPLLLT